MKILNNRLIIFLFSLFFSLLFTKYYFIFTHEFYEPASSSKMAEFEADKVFQKRVLPIFLADMMSSTLGIPLDKSLKAICTITCVAILFGFQALVREITQKKTGILWAYFVFIPVGWNYLALNSIYHTYDLPCLAFYCWGLYCFLSKRFFLFYVLFWIGSFNRESTCFISISIFVLLFQSPNSISLSNLWNTNRTLLIHCFSQFLIWFGTKMTLEFIFKENPGSFYEETYSMKKFMQDLWHGDPSWPFLDTTTFLGNPRSFLTLFAGVWIILPFIWRSVPSKAKKLLWIVPPYLIAAFIHANLMESRVYHELNIVLSAVIVSGLIYRIQDHSFSKQ